MREILLVDVLKLLENCWLRLLRGQGDHQVHQEVFGDEELAVLLGTFYQLTLDLLSAHYLLSERIKYFNGNAVFANIVIAIERKSLRRSELEANGAFSRDEHHVVILRIRGKFELLIRADLPLFDFLLKVQNLLYLLKFAFLYWQIANSTKLENVVFGLFLFFKFLPFKIDFEVLLVNLAITNLKFIVLFLILVIIILVPSFIRHHSILPMVIFLYLHHCIALFPFKNVCSLPSSCHWLFLLFNLLAIGALSRGKALLASRMRATPHSFDWRDGLFAQVASTRVTLIS